MNKKIVMPKNMAELMELIKKASSEGAEVEFVNVSSGESSGIDGFLEAMKKAKTVEFPDPDAKPRSIEELLSRHGHTGEEHCPARDEVVKGKPGTSELASRLLDVVAVHQNPPTYKPGQFVRYREHVVIARHVRGLSCIVENITPFSPDHSDEDMGSPTAYRKYDVLVASESHGGICVYPEDSRELEIYPDADKLLGKKSS